MKRRTGENNPPAAPNSSKQGTHMICKHCYDCYVKNEEECDRFCRGADCEKCGLFKNLGLVETGEKAESQSERRLNIKQCLWISTVFMSGTIFQASALSLIFGTTFVESFLHLPMLMIWLVKINPLYLLIPLSNTVLIFLLALFGYHRLKI